MKKILLLLVVIFMAGCSFNRTPHLDATKELPIDIGNRSGKACSISLLGFIGTFGDDSIATAAKRGEISTISYYEPSYNYYILWSSFCNRVYGYGKTQTSDYYINRSRWTR